MVEVGRSYYFLTHAYWHFLGTVRAVLGKRHVVVDNVVFIYSSKKNWTDFFKSGIGTGDTTTYRLFPDGSEITYIDAFPWAHKIPTKVQHDTD